jgi:hypothetical protein
MVEGEGTRPQKEVRACDRVLLVLRARIQAEPRDTSAQQVADAGYLSSNAIGI